MVTKKIVGQVATAMILALTLPIAALCEVKPMTRDRLPEAIAAGESCRKRHDLYISKTTRGGKSWKKILMGKTSGSGFTVYVETPFSLISQAAFDGKKKFDPLSADDVDLPDLDQQFVVVTVRPQGTYMEDQVIEGVAAVVIEREGEIIKPTEAETTEHSFANAYGGRREVAKGGAFLFPLDVFNPGQDIRIIVVPESSDSDDQWWIDLKDKDLQELR